MNGTLRRRFWAWLVLLVAVGAVLGHVCVVPHHAHADEAAASSERQAGHDESDDHALHGASCEALRTSPAHVAVVATTSSIGAPPVPPLLLRAARLAAPISRADSPSLFLLYAALLI